MLRKLLRIIQGRGEDPDRPEYVDALAVARAERAANQLEAEKLGLLAPGEPLYLVEGRAAALETLGVRWVNHPDNPERKLAPRKIEAPAFLRRTTRFDRTRRPAREREAIAAPEPARAGKA